jgi:hypothetical protein
MCTWQSRIVSRYHTPALAPSPNHIAITPLLPALHHLHCRQLRSHAHAHAPPLSESATCHSCQNLPDANIVSWMGNEETRMPYPVWNANDAECSHNGGASGYGVPSGERWCPAHCDAVLRRHFWFWNDGSYNTSSNLNTAPDLLSMHMTSVGRGCNMVLDMSPTTSGLLEQIDTDTCVPAASHPQATDQLHCSSRRPSHSILSLVRDARFLLHAIEPYVVTN